MPSLHKTRKTIKEVIYLSEADGGMEKKEMKFYDQMQDVLGELHDKQVLLGLLWMKNNVAIDTQKAIESACDSDKKEMLRLAMDKVQKSFSFSGLTQPFFYYFNCFFNTTLVIRA